jgi:hypothetical protein
MTLNSGVIATNQPDGSLLLDFDGYELRCNAMGRKIWERLRDGASVSLVVDEIAAAFVVPRTIVENDVAEFLGQLRHNFLIQD